MQPTRRQIFAATGALIASAPFALSSARAQTAPAAKPAADPRMAERSFGSPAAKTVVEEWF
jgi:hypothetical protein